MEGGYVPKHLHIISNWATVFMAMEEALLFGSSSVMRALSAIKLTFGETLKELRCFMAKRVNIWILDF